MTKPSQANVSLNDQNQQIQQVDIAELTRLLDLDLPPADSHSHPPNGTSAADQAGPESSEPPQSGQVSLNMGRSLGQIFIILVVLLVLINIPFNSYQAGLAQLMPDSSATIIRQGMLLKGNGPAVYLLDTYKLRRVSRAALNIYFRNRHISTVEDSDLDQFAQGPPIYYLHKCQAKPDVYAVENGYKWRIAEPPTNPTQRWDRVHVVPCIQLERLPDVPSKP